MQWVTEEALVQKEDADKTEHPTAQASKETSEDDGTRGLDALSEGRVYNASLAKQVHVFPTPATSDMEVTMATWSGS